MPRAANAAGEPDTTTTVGSTLNPTPAESIGHAVPNDGFERLRRARRQHIRSASIGGEMPTTYRARCRPP
jgi:hypothetical protein